MKRSLILLLTVALLAAPAIPAAAKKPPTQPDRFIVTMELSGDQSGLATTCEGPLTLEGSVQRGFASANPLLFIQDSGDTLNWERSYPTSPAGSGCHGAVEVVVPPGQAAPDVFGGALWLNFGSGGTVDVLWRFDYYWKYGLTGKRLVQEVLEFSGLTGTLTGFDSTSYQRQLVTGDLALTLFTKEGKTIINDHLPMGAVNVSFYLTITPAP